METRKEFRELEAQVAMIYASWRPSLAKGFAQFVLKQGHGAVVPPEHNGRRLRYAGRTWQWVGRELYGEDFVAALKALIEERDAQKAKE